MPIDAAEAMTKANAAKGIVASQVIRDEIVEVTRVRAGIDHPPGNGEEERADDAVGKHLQDRAGNPEHVRRGQAEEDETHVADARIADDKFQIALPQRDGGRVNDPDDSRATAIHCSTCGSLAGKDSSPRASAP